VCRERAARPWSEWAGDAHVWGVGVEKRAEPTKPTKKPRAVKTSASDQQSQSNLFIKLGVVA